MTRIFLIAVSLIFALAAAGNALAAAERRVALVIGNNDYQNVTKLEKAVNDANAVARELKKIGFEVMAYNNVGQKKMNLAVNEFVQKISGGGVGVFFFAGHGLQVNNQNFLVPVDMDSPRSENDLADQAVSVLAIQDKIADAKAKFTLLVLDACRDNPLPKKSGTRSIGATRGLAPPQAPNGQVVLYSAGANQQALDKLGDNDNNPNGLFTREFLPSITQPGISATDAMRKVRSKVTQKAKSVGHDQQPALYEQTDGDFYFVAGPATAPTPGSATTVVQTVDPKAVELAFWDSIKNSNAPDDFSDYLSKYPDGQFSALAKRRLGATNSDRNPRWRLPDCGAGADPTGAQQPAATRGGNCAEHRQQDRGTGQDGFPHGERPARHPARQPAAHPGRDHQHRLQQPAAVLSLQVARSRRLLRLGR
jgi:TolA-binding protein